MNRTHNKILFVILALAALTFIISGMAGAVGTDEFNVVLQAGIANNGAVPQLGQTSDVALNTLLTDSNPSNDPLIVDLRTADEYAKGHIVGSILNKCLLQNFGRCQCYKRPEFSFGCAYS